MDSKENTPGVGTVPQVISSTGIKIGKFKASWMIVKESWNILKQDRELIWFPVLSFIFSLIALILMGALFFNFVMGGDVHYLKNIRKDGINALGYVILFIYYLVMFFITNYFIAGIYIIVKGRFSGKNLSFSDGINGANNNLEKIFMWALISATVGVILRIIAGKFKIVGRIVALLLGAAWSILTYFSLPSLIIGQKSVKESFKESAALIRKTWGETIIVNFGVGLFFTVIFFVGLAFCLGIVIFVPIFTAILFIVFIIIISLISSTLGSIYKLALYEFALTNNIPKGFTPELVKEAIKTEKQIGDII